MTSQVKPQSQPQPQAHPSAEVELSPWSTNHRDVAAAEAASNAIEERDHNASDRVSDIDVEDRVIQQLLPADGGPAAWRVLVAAFVFEALLWGFPISFGVFQAYYTTIPQFSASSSQLALIGTIAQGLTYLGSPFSAYLTKRFPKYQIPQLWLGWFTCIASLIIASFQASVQGLIWTQGVMYGLSFLLLMYPIISMINEWWVVRKGMAFGVISAASGVSGAALPLGIEWLLARYGYHTALRVIAVGIAICTAPLLPLLKGRLPAAEHSQTARTDWTFLRVPLFWIYAVSTLVYGLGFFYPGVYLPSFAKSVGLSSTQGAAILAVMSVAQVAGQFACGWASDHSKKFSVSVACVVCLLMATMASFVLWGLAKSLGLLMVFGVVYGFFGYGYSTMRVAMGRQVSRDASSTVATYSILVFVQGIGNVLVGPISNGLLEGGVRKDVYGIGRYKDLVVWTGGCMAVSAGVIGLWWMRLSRFKGVS
ncbi:hypothetical protein ACMFMG_001518 [Clarireedia jacksonii]